MHECEYRYRWKSWSTNFIVSTGTCLDFWTCKFLLRNGGELEVKTWGFQGELLSQGPGYTIKVRNLGLLKAAKESCALARHIQKSPLGMKSNRFMGAIPPKEDKCGVGKEQ